MAQPFRPAEKQHSVRLAFGNGLRPQIWEEFQSRFGIKQIGEFYGSTEGTASIVNIDSKAGACGFVSEIAPAIYPVTIIKVDPDTGEIVRGADGLAVRTKPGDVGQIVGKSSAGILFYFIRADFCEAYNNVVKFKSHERSEVTCKLW